MGAPIPDQTWGRLVRGLGARQRALTGVLPYRIGITWRPDGTWSEYVRFEPIYDLPGYMADAVAGGVGARALDRFRRAHHCAGFYGLVIDRVADGQVVEDRALRWDRVWLRVQWLRTLTAACGSASVAQRAIAEAQRRWREAVALEQRVHRDGHMEPEAYSAIVRGKVAWLWTASELMLRAQGVGEGTRATLRDAFERVMIALQCSDDAADVEEDKALRGTSVPEALGVTPGGLQATAALVLRQVSNAEKRSAERDWQEALASAVLALVPESEAISARIAASFLVQGFVTEIHAF